MEIFNNDMNNQKIENINLPEDYEKLKEYSNTLEEKLSNLKKGLMISYPASKIEEKIIFLLSIKVEIDKLITMSEIIKNNEKDTQYFFANYGMIIDPLSLHNLKQTYGIKSNEELYEIISEKDKKRNFFKKLFKGF